MDHWNICRTRERPQALESKVTKQVGHFWYLSPINVVVVVSTFFIYIHVRGEIFMAKMVLRLDFHGVSVYSGWG